MITVILLFTVIYTINENKTKTQRMVSSTYLHESERDKQQT